MRIALFIMSALLFSSYFLIAQVKDDIIEKHINAIGGDKNWQNIKTISTTAIRESEGSSVEERKQIVLNKFIRIDYKFKTRDAAIDQKKYFIIINENQGWRYMPDNIKDTVEMLSAAEIKYYKAENFVLDPFLQANQSGAKIEYMNKESVSDRDCFKFSINYASGRHEYIYLDAFTYLISKRVSIQSDSESELDFEDYRKVNNIYMFPFTVATSYEKYIVKDIQINTPVNDQIFKPGFKMQ